MDSDLIFDSIEETNNVYSHDRQQTSSIEESKSSHGEEDQHWLSGALHRIRRHIGSIFSSGEVKEVKRRTRQEDDNFLGQDQNEYDDDDQENVNFS